VNRFVADIFVSAFAGFFAGIGTWAITGDAHLGVAVGVIVYYMPRIESRT